MRLSWGIFKALRNEERLEALQKATPRELILLEGERQDEIVQALALRVETLERKLSDSALVDFCGVFRSGGEYRRGAAVTHQGSLWISEQDPTGPPPGNGWRLAVKKGRAEGGEHGVG